MHNESDWFFSGAIAVTYVNNLTCIYTHFVKKKITEIFEIIDSIPHGNVACCLGTLKKIGLGKLIDPERSRKRDLIIAMIVARIINPAVLLATVRGLNRDTGSSSLGKILNLAHANSNECYEALDWLLSKQEEIENKLARKHLTEGELILYDLTSTPDRGNSLFLG